MDKPLSAEEIKVIKDFVADQIERRSNKDATDNITAALLRYKTKWQEEYASQYKNQTPVQEAKEETVSKEKVGRLLHAILNYSYEGFKGELGALRDSVVPVYVIETAFKEYFGIVEPEPNF